MILGDAVDRLDRTLGDGLEAAVRLHHRRRLRRVGQLSALDPPESAALWADADPPPRPGNRVEVLIDGAEALPAIADAVGDARRFVHIAGWHVTPDFELCRDGDVVRLRDLLAGVAARGVEVRVLLWAGAPVPVGEPRRATVRELRRQLVEGTAIRCALDTKERPLHCHHEKTVVVDGDVAFVGGIDLTRLSGDRFDHSSHTTREDKGWHDCATRLHGPIVADVAAHFAMRWHEVAREPLPRVAPRPPAGDVEVQMVRTVPERAYDAMPNGAFSALEAYVRALRSARRLIYLESQYLWSPEIVDILRDKLRHPPTDDFRLVVMLPAKPNTGGDDTRGQLGALIEADADAGRFLACTVFARDERAHGPVYVHAKVGIVDDSWLTIGSVNLNEHSFFNDSEVNVVTCDARLARETRERLWSEHLELPLDEIRGADPLRMIEDVWKPVSREQRERLTAGNRLTHRLVRLPGVSRRSDRLLGPLQSLLVDG